MKRTILITMMAFIAGLFIAGNGFAAGEHGQEWDSQSQAGMTQDQGAGMAQQMTNQQVRTLQNLLNEKGFDSGPVDGIIGPKTTSAIRNFQESRGLAATGSPDRDTLQELAPDAETQEQLGLSPEFGEEGMGQQQQQQDMDTQQDMESQQDMGTQEQDQMGPDQSGTKDW
ncbi:MAG: peptidoglycan-binding domain-containing protein [Syntrophotaleaceae bacterium]